MNILVTIDDKYTDRLIETISSVKFYNRENLNIYVIYDKLEQKNIDILKKFMDDQEIGTINFIEFKNVDIQFSITLSYITTNTYYRLYAPFFIGEDIDRILYLDCDIVCTGNINQFYYQDFEENIIIGCQDFYLSNQKNNNYINAGVYLIDLKKYRETTSICEINRFIEQNKNDIEYQDQDILNRIFDKKIKIVSDDFNYQINSVNPGYEWDYANIIHYANSEKPWNDSYYDPIKALSYYKNLYLIGKHNLAVELSNKHFKNQIDILFNPTSYKHTATVDIIIPSYNASRTICDTLDSIALQVLDDIKVTVYLIDDFSDDDYSLIIDKYKDKLDLKYFRMDRNSGVALARQRGIDEGKGDFFTIIDSDDQFISPYAIQALYYAIIESGADVVRSVFFEEKDHGYKLYRNDNIACHGKMYRKQFILEHNIRYLDLRGNEDTAYNALVKICNAKYYDLNIMTYRWCNNKLSFTRKDEFYHEIDLVNFGKGFIWVAEEAIKRSNYINDVSNKIAELIGRIYLRINDCWTEEAYQNLYTSTAKIYLMYRKISKDSIAEKIKEQFDVNDSYNLYFDFLSKVQDKMYELDEYKKLSNEEKINLGQIYKESSMIEKYNNYIVNNTTTKELLKKNIAKIGKNSLIDAPIKFECYRKKLHIGENVKIESNLTVEGDSNIYIGNKTRIGKNVTILTNKHIINPKLRNYIYTSEVIIGENVYIGRNVTILPGVTIGNNTFIEEGSVVFNNVGENSIASGNPCKVMYKIDDFDDIFYDNDKKIPWNEVEVDLE